MRLLTSKILEMFIYMIFPVHGCFPFAKAK